MRIQSYTSHPMLKTTQSVSFAGNKIDIPVAASEDELRHSLGLYTHMTSGGTQIAKPTGCKKDVKSLPENCEKNPMPQKFLLIMFTYLVPIDFAVLEGGFDCLFKRGKYVNKGDPTVRPLELFMCSVVKRLLVDMESFWSLSPGLLQLRSFRQAKTSAWWMNFRFYRCIMINPASQGANYGMSSDDLNPGVPNFHKWELRRGFAIHGISSWLSVRCNIHLWRSEIVETTFVRHGHQDILWLLFWKCVLNVWESSNTKNSCKPVQNLKLGKGQRTM